MQTIIVFQQNGSGQSKIDGIMKYGKGLFSIKTHDIDKALPEIIDDATGYLPGKIEADLVLDFLKHHDLSAELAQLCKKLDIPVIMSGKKITTGNAICPPT